MLMLCAQDVDITNVCSPLPHIACISAIFGGSWGGYNIIS